MLGDAMWTWMLGGLCLVPLICGQSFSDCFNSAAERVASSSCPVEDTQQRRDCIANVLTMSVLPCFKEASQLDLVHLLVPEIDESFVTALRDAAANYLDFSGKEVIIHSAPPSGLLEEIMAHIETNDMFYSGWVVPSACLPFQNEAGLLLDVTANLTTDVAFDWLDVAGFYRKDVISIDDRAMSIPVSGDLVLLYYRKDIFEANNITQPETWEQVLILAEAYNGTDLNNDGILDYGTCLVNHTGDGSRSLWIKSIMAPYFQHMGVQQGLLFDSESMEPLTDNDAMAWVLELYRELASFGPYSHSQITGITGAELFESGRCLVTVGSVQIFHEYGKGDGERMVGVAELPGSWYVYNRDAEALMRCTNTLCPHGRTDSLGNIVNFAPYVGPQSLIGTVNRLSPKASRESMFTFLSYVGGRSLSFELVTSIRHLDAFRWSHLQVDRWLERGWNYFVALDYINAMSRSFVSGNIALEPRVPPDLLLDAALEDAGDQLIRLQDDSMEILRNLRSTLETRIDAYGKETVLRAYRTSLHLQVLEDGNGQRTSSSGGVNMWALVLGLALPLILLSFCSIWFLHLFRNSGRLKDRRPVKPPVAGPQTSLVITDIQDSTTLWETVDADVMDEALQLHNQCLRDILRENNGYESATEGDAFIIAFHTAYDAVKFCYEAQLALMDLDWPEEILQASVYSSVVVNHEENTLKHVTRLLLVRNGGDSVEQDLMAEADQMETEDPNNTTEQASNATTTVDYGNDVLTDRSATEYETTTADDEDLQEELFIFRGLRVRMGVFTGVHSNSEVMMNDASGRMMYSGLSMSMTKAISDVGSGGQIIISESTYKSMTLEKLLEDVHVLHVGEHILSDTLPVTQFYEIVEKSLTSRLLHFPPLKAQALSPAWYDAPSGMVCISFTFVVGAETLSQWNGKAFRESLQIYESVAKERLQYYGGYQVEAADGLLLVAFSSPVHAIAWGLTLHEELTKAEWPDELLSHPLCEKLSVHSVDHWGQVHLKDIVGLRLKTGIEMGPAKCNPHPTTGFMAYRGKVINRSARITKLASGGQVYASRTVWEAAQDHPVIKDLGIRWRSMGTQKLKGVVETVDVYHLFLESQEALRQVSLEIRSKNGSSYSTDSEF